MVILGRSGPPDTNAIAALRDKYDSKLLSSFQVGAEPRLAAI